MKMQKAQKGFTLIELMIVIAIVGILAAIALPAYQNYIVRSKMSEPMAALAEAKTTVAEYISARNNWPTSDTSYGISLTTRNSDIFYRVQIVDPEPDNSGTVYLIAEVYNSVWKGGDPNTSEVSAFALSGETSRDGSMTWECISYKQSYTGVEVKYLPANCRG